MFAQDGSEPPRWNLVEQVPAHERRVTVRSSVPSRVRCRLPEPYKWQAEALAAWKKRGRRGVIEAVTGTGKTYVALAAAHEALQRGEKVLILVPTIELLNQWHEALREAFVGCRLGRLGDASSGRLRTSDILVSSVHSARDAALLPAKARGLLIADEVHRYGAETFARALDPAFEARMGLTATYERTDEGLEEHLVPYFGDVCIRVTYSEAVPAGYVSRFKIVLVGAQLTQSERQEFEELDKKTKDAMAWLLLQGLPREPFGEFMRLVSQLAEGGAARQATWKARTFLSAFQRRREILANSYQKLERLHAVAPALDFGDRSLVFTQTTAGADEAAELLRTKGLRAASLHSKLNRQQRQALMHDFRRRRLDVLAAPRVLDEGIDVPGAETAVIIAATHSRRQMIQRMGRVLRNKDRPRLARMVVMYAEGTPEDPARGGHADFLEEALVVADAAQVFSSRADASAIRNAIEDSAITGPMREPGQIPLVLDDGRRVRTRSLLLGEDPDDELDDLATAEFVPPRGRLAKRLERPTEASEPRPRPSSRATAPLVSSAVGTAYRTSRGKELRADEIRRLRRNGILLRIEQLISQLGNHAAIPTAIRARRQGGNFWTAWEDELHHLQGQLDREGRMSAQLPPILPTKASKASDLPPIMRYDDDTG